jgi:hypothetical protein
MDGAEAECQRKAQAHQHSGREDRDYTRLDGGRGAPARLIAPTEESQGRWSGNGRSDLRERQPSVPVVPTRQHARCQRATQRDSREHGCQHRRERVGRCCQELHKHSEPHDLERERCRPRQCDDSEHCAAEACARSGRRRYVATALRRWPHRSDLARRRDTRASTPAPRQQCSSSLQGGMRGGCRSCQSG